MQCSVGACLLYPVSQGLLEVNRKINMLCLSNPSLTDMSSFDKEICGFVYIISRGLSPTLDKLLSLTPQASASAPHSRAPSTAGRHNLSCCVPTISSSKTGLWGPRSKAGVEKDTS